jgi:hypothetical protein
LLQVSDHPPSQFDLLWLVVVVDSELAEKDLVLVVGEGPPQARLCILVGQASLLNQRPEDRVVLFNRKRMTRF